MRDSRCGASAKARLPLLGERGETFRVISGRQNLLERGAFLRETFCQRTFDSTMHEPLDRLLALRRTRCDQTRDSLDMRFEPIRGKSGIDEADLFRPLCAHRLARKHELQRN